MKKLLLFAVLIVGMFAFLSLVSASPLLAATPKEDVCKGVALTGGSCNDTSGGPNVQSVIRDVINILSFVVGVVAVIMVIIGGLRYITSGGDSNSTSAAKNTILYAVIGLVIVAMAQVIVRFVLSRFE